MGKLLLCFLACALTSCAYHKTVTVQEGQTIRWTPAGSELLRTSGEAEPETIDDGMDVYHSSFGEIMTVRTGSNEETYWLEFERVVVMRNGDVFLNDEPIATLAEEIRIEIPAITEVQNVGYGDMPWYETVAAATVGTLLVALMIPVLMFGQVVGSPHFGAAAH